MERGVSLAEELKPLMVFARAMGVAPYTIKNNIYKISPWAFFYTMILNMVNFIFVLIEAHEPRTISRNMKIAALLRIRFLVPLVAVILNTFYTLLRRRESSKLFRIVNKFDTSINLRPGTKKHFAIIWVYMLLSIVMGLIYTVMYAIDPTTISRGNMESKIFLLNSAVIFSRTTASVSFFLAMLCSMQRRFQELDRTIERDSKDVDMTDIVLRKSVGMRKLWILYDQLTEATENLNSMYSAELLVWIFVSSLFFLMRLHIVRYQYQLKPIDTYISSIAIIVIALRLLFLTWFCHSTASMANDVVAKAFRINWRASRLNRSWDTEDTFIIGQYFVVRRSVEITAGGGLFSIDLPLLRTIIATVVTYLVILRSPDEERQEA